ncbi:hypothetical protein CDAR_369041 [Caerostris darwini]|uniref:Uncharacterized protein n=1 Tax=Caerostris darwini TaxID=1538125 RepID=A0AAV4PID6_9ARAC|nr:hypothetical protein CDAR_369041 [Caerostris darwini]
MSTDFAIYSLLRMNRFQYLPSKTIVLFSIHPPKRRSPEGVRWARGTRPVLRGNKEKQPKPKRVFCLLSFSNSGISIFTLENDSSVLHPPTFRKDVPPLHSPEGVRWAKGKRLVLRGNKERQPKRVFCLFSFSISDVIDLRPKCCDDFNIYSRKRLFCSPSTLRKKVHPLVSPEEVRLVEGTWLVLRGNKERQPKPKRVFCLFSFSISDEIYLRPKCFYGAFAISIFTLENDCSVLPPPHEKKAHTLNSPEGVRWAEGMRLDLRGNKERQAKPKRVFCLFSFSISDEIYLLQKCFDGASAWERNVLKDSFVVLLTDDESFNSKKS